jgi:hypothetical protein
MMYGINRLSYMSSCSDDVWHQQAQLEQQIHHDFHNLQSQHQQVAAQKLRQQQQQQQQQAAGP